MTDQHYAEFKPLIDRVQDQYADRSSAIWHSAKMAKRFELTRDDAMEALSRHFGSDALIERALRDHYPTGAIR